MWYMPWSENIKKRACRYLLQRYLGDYLEQKLTLEQLSVDLYNGTGTVSNVSLDCEALNDVGDKQNWPLEIVDGHIREITVTIPWSTLFKDHCIVEVRGLTVTVQPKMRAEPVSSMLESMWSSMSSSMQLAAECLGEDEVQQETQSVDGIEMFAHAIDSVLSRVKVKFVDTNVRIEHVPINSDRGIALEIHIENINYFDEAGAEPKPEETDPDKCKTYIEATCTNKRIQCSGVTFYTDEFPSKLRTMARSLEKSTISQPEVSHIEDINFQSATSDLFYETTSVISTLDNDPVKETGEPSIKNVELTPEERASQPKPVLFGKLSGEQELSLKLKHTDEMDAPKIEINILLGSFVVFISPRQLHTMVELSNALSQPQLEDTSNVPLRSNAVKIQCKPMRQADFQFIEAQLLGNFQQENVKLSSGRTGWSGSNFDSDAESDKFLPMTSPANQMADSFSSSVSSMNTSMHSSITIPSSQPRNKHIRKAVRVDGDPTADVTHISLKIASLTCVLIHKDIILVNSQVFNQVIPSTVEKMRLVSTQFFDNLAKNSPNEGIPNYVPNEAIEKSTDLSHLRLIATDISLNGSDKVTSHGSQTTCEASAKHVLVQECLYSKTEDGTKPNTYNIIRFSTKENSEKHSSVSRPNIRVNFKQTSKYMRLAGEKKPDYPETDIIIKCTPMNIEVDLTIMERMSATFFGGPRVPPSSPTSTHNQFNFTLQSPNLKASLRFPIADLRARDPRVNDLRSIRNDYLVFAFQNATISSQKVASIRPQPTTIAVKCTTLDLLYHEHENLPATHIARTTMDENCDCDLKCTNPMLPTISLTFRAATSNKSPFETEIYGDHFAPVGGNPMTTSMYVLNNLSNAEPSPFSGKKMAHQSVIKARESNSEDAKEEELIIPGTEEEMTGFTNSAVSLSDIHLEFNLPVLSLQLESKQLYEIIYNRINSDLLLWEPNILDEADTNPEECGNIYPFDMCKGGYNSDSGSSSSEDEYFGSSRPQRPVNVVPEKKETHSFCLTFKVNKGLLTIYAPVRDSNKLVVPGQMGELVLEAHKLSLCHVSGIHGVSKTGQLCLRAGTVTLYHEAMLSIPSEKPCLRLYGSRLPPHLKKTIYPSSNGVILKETLETKDMFSIALKVNPDPETSNIKTLCTALGVERATLRHRGERGYAWLSQLMDVLDVLDYPVPGYAPSTVVSELHVHLADCAVDYRPLYLPIRSVVILGNFNISNNIIPATNTSCLKFLAQECALFISHIHGTKPNSVPQDDDKLPNVFKDYVCVIDMGLFELMLRMDDKSNPSKDHPNLELSASNNMVNVYTCWDSGTALCHLITYVAADGDSQPPYDRSSRHTSICSDPPTEPLVGLDDRPVEEIRELSPNEIQQVNELMEEALKESPNTTLEDEELNSSTDKEMVEVFFFPDESNMKQKRLESGTESESKAEYEEFCSGIPKDGHETKPVHPQVAKDLGVPTTPKPAKKSKRKKKCSGSGNNTDDEYCIVEAQAPRGAEEDLDEPVVRWLSAGPLCVSDNHFTVPAARTDVLKAPKSFPVPILRYTLFEMSITWHLFGGNDFRSVGEPAPKKTVTIDDARKQGSPTTAKRVEYEPYAGSAAEYRAGVRWTAGSERVRTTRPPPDARTRGGHARDAHVCVKLCLTKVKFQHETYPSSGVHASRQTLAISKIEVLDQLYCSDINKLLTLYKMKDEPDRKNAHMLIVKAVHLRSEPTLSAQECCLKVSLLPLRFNLDQDTLAFLVGFFSKFGTEDGAEEETKSVGGGGSLEGGSRQTTPTHRPPVMGVASHLRDPPPTPTSLGDGDALSLNDTVNREDGPLLEPYEAERLVSENLIQLEEDFNRLGVSEEKPPAKTHADSEPIDDSPIYFRRVVFSPEVPIRLDYVGKRVDLSAGPVAGLLMGLGHLNCSELTLRRLDYKLGLLGLEKLVQWALHEWLTDIKRHQLPGLLSGIGPMHSLLQLITGIRDLVWMPVEQWRRDGRLVHGLRRGAASFTARTAVAALDITTRLLHLIQATAETAFDMLTPGPTLQLQDAYDRRQRRRRRRADPARQPADLRQGVATAYHTVKEGIAETAATITLVARCESGVSVLRHLPGAAVAPLALAAAGAADVLGGMRAHLAPHSALDDRDKWRATHSH